MVFLISILTSCMSSKCDMIFLILIYNIVITFLRLCVLKQLFHFLKIHCESFKKSNGNDVSVKLKSSSNIYPYPLLENKSAARLKPWVRTIDSIQFFKLSHSFKGLPLMKKNTLNRDIEN